MESGNRFPSGKNCGYPWCCTACFRLASSPSKGSSNNNDEPNFRHWERKWSRRSCFIRRKCRHWSTDGSNTTVMSAIEPGTLRVAKTLANLSDKAIKFNTSFCGVSGDLDSFDAGTFTFRCVSFRFSF